ncbi:MAG: acyl carrier protein [Oscillospiraceae bacterium]|nr:acyl carrier protein [Oscillospiraceae bacterium]
MKQEILELLEDAVPSVDFSASDRMMDDGLLDSLTIVQIIGELSMEYDVEFSFEDLVPDNFNSIDSIVALVERKLN